MKQAIFTTFICLLFSSFAFGQSPFFEPGEVTMKNGTIREGFIEKSAKKKMEKGIMFKESVKSPPIYYSHDNITSYRFTNYNEEYRAVEVKISKGVGVSAKWITKQKFSRVLIDGDITLLRVYLSKTEYNSDIVGTKGYFYVLFKNGQKYQIDQQDPVKLSTLSQVSYSFRQKMGIIFPNCPSVVPLVAKMEFMDSDFVEIIQAYQGCNDLDVEYFELKASPNTFYNHHIGGGLMLITGEGIARQSSFGAGYAGEFRFPGFSPKMGLTVSGEIASYTYEYYSFPVSKFLFKQRTQLGWYFAETTNFSFQLHGGLLWQSVIAIPSENIDFTPFLRLDLAAKVRVKQITLALTHEPGARTNVTSLQAFFNIGSTRKTQKQLIERNQKK